MPQEFNQLKIQHELGTQLIKILLQLLNASFNKDYSIHLRVKIKLEYRVFHRPNAPKGKTRTNFF